MSFLERPCPTCIKRDTSYSRSCFLRFGLGGRKYGVCGRRILADLDSQRAEQGQTETFPIERSCTIASQPVSYIWEYYYETRRCEDHMASFADVRSMTLALGMWL